MFARNADRGQHLGRQADTHGGREQTRLVGGADGVARAGAKGRGDDLVVEVLKASLAEQEDQLLAQIDSLIPAHDNEEVFDGGAEKSALGANFPAGSRLRTLPGQLGCL